MKTGLTNLALLLASIIICAVAIEVSLRLLGQGTAGTREGNRVRHAVTGEFDHYALLNSLDLRDEEIQDKSDDEFRILVVGDSFTYGLGVEEEYTFVRRTEELLRDLAKSERFSSSIRVINGGVGLGPVHQFSWLKNVGMSLRPDVVVQAFFVGNDIYDDIVSRDYSNVGIPVAPNEPLRALISRSELLTWMFARLIGFEFFDKFAFELGLRYSKRGIFLRDIPDVEQAAWNRTLETLFMINEFALQEAIDYSVLIIPTSDQVRYGSDRASEEDYMLPNKILSEFLRRHDIAFLDLLPLLKEEPMKHDFYYSRDMHWTADGHRAASESFGPWLWEHIRMKGLWSRFQRR